MMARLNIPQSASSEDHLNIVCNSLIKWLNEKQAPSFDENDPFWAAFKVASRVHGVAPLLYKSVELEVDHPIQPWLASQYSWNTQRIDRMKSELTVILSCFVENNVAIIPLKGTLLIDLIYEAAGMRPMADLDLLIHPADMEKAQSLLEGLGYRADVVHWKHTEFIKPNNQDVVSAEVEHPDNPRGLEIHTFCRESFGGIIVDLTNYMWETAKPGKLLGVTTLLPSLELLWLHLIVHATYHFWQGKGRLIQLVDLARLTPRLANLEITLGLVDPRFTYPALVLLNKYFPQTIDRYLIDDQQRNLSPKFLDWADNLNLVNASHLNPHPPGPYLIKALNFSEGRLKESLQALRFAFIPSLNEISLDHPWVAKSKFPWLAYFLLPIDWLRRFK